MLEAEEGRESIDMPDMVDWHTADVARDRGALTPTQRGEHILALAATLLRDGVDDPEVIAYAFQDQFGSATMRRSEIKIDARGMLGGPPDELDGSLTIYFRIVTATDWDKLDGIGFIPEDYRWLREHFPDANRKRARWRRPATIIGSLAVFYLSIDGGGHITEEDAVARCQTDERLADVTATWDRSTHAKILRQLRHYYGPAAAAPPSMAP